MRHPSREEWASLSIAVGAAIALIVILGVWG